ncbi:endonuclease/exonuclease/phosphatase family protein [Methylocystis sp.]|uniref:endonuclease/exonuclease/phosphatase family protein n=1 Tax=Methylocystis sp. TaxID=1911079 RepID=UPI003DA2B4E9
MPNYFSLKQAKNSARIISGLERLRAQLDREIPDRSLEKTLRLATWNIREFDSPAYGARTDDAFYFIAEIVSRFDLVAIQEVRRDLTALKTLLKHLGWHWKYVVTDTTEGVPGNNERLAFLYDTRKVQFTGLAGELVLPDVKDAQGKPVPARQLVRTPFTAGFRSGWVELQLATVHILYGEDKANDENRTAEIGNLAKFLAERAQDPESASPNLVLLGDFNIFDRTDATMTALTDAGWKVPQELRDLPGSNVPQDKFYDQIAVLPIAHHFQAAGPAGILDFYESVFRLEDQKSYVAAMGPAYETTSSGSKRTEAGKKTYFKAFWRTFQMSDHLPMWIDLKIDYSQEYLDGVRAQAGDEPDNG